MNAILVQFNNETFTKNCYKYYYRAHQPIIANAYLIMLYRVI